jgi:hypothetical protein
MRIAACILSLALSACKSYVVTYEETVKSPESNWIAFANTKEYGAFPGTAHIDTAVYLKWLNNPPIEILSFVNDVAYPSGITKVQMQWVTPSHLDVKYDSHNARINFQAIMCANIHITLESK